nr:hypothetical protein [uncultured Carboxylicivirga sp.]
MRLRNYLLLILFFNVCSNIVAQVDFRPGYIITNSLDTVTGLLDYRGDVRNMKVCSFKENETGDVIQYKPTDIYGYRFESGKYYVSKYLEDKSVKDTVFVEFLLKGIYNLYFYKNPNYLAYYIDSRDGGLLVLDNDEMIIEKKGTKYVKHSNRYIGLLRYTFNDCPEIQRDIVGASLSHKSLINITKKYHEYKCDGEQCIIYEKKIPVLTVDIEPFVGYSLSKMSLKQLGVVEDMDLDLSHSFSYGLALNLNLPRFNEKMSVAFNFQMNDDNYYGTSFIDHNRVYNDKYYCDIKTKSLLTGIELRYTYPKGNFRPELFIGGCFNYLLDSDMSLTKESVVNDRVITKKDQLDFLNNSNRGLTGGVGLKYRLFNKVNVFNRLRCVYVNEKQKHEVKLNTVSYCLSMGVIL